MLHQRLHAMPHPRGSARSALGTRGPQVMDWANVHRGHWADDVAQTVVILAGALVPAPITARRLADPNLSEMN